MGTGIRDCGGFQVSGSQARLDRLPVRSGESSDHSTSQYLSVVITEALQHCHGIGPVRLHQLQDAGVRTWHDAVDHPDRLPKSLRQTVVEECERCLEAQRTGDLEYLVQTLHPQDRWRILHEYFDRASWFDIETTGLEVDSLISVIVCWHRGQLHTFVQGENLDDFLDLLEDVDLLVSFNGSAFDVPRVADGFRIPEMPCPHLDLRWICYWHGLEGGLKQICEDIEIQRPADLRNTDGEEAVWLWEQWHSRRDRQARAKLIRYCAADVMLMRPVANSILERAPMSAEQIWDGLPEELNSSETPLTRVDAPEDSTDSADRHRRRRELLAGKFGPAGPSRLRTLRRRKP